MSDINVLFVLSSLGGGGAERVAVNVVSALHGQGFNFSLALMKNEGVYFEEIPSGIQVYDLEKGNGIALPVSIRRVVNLTNLVSRLKPEIVLSFLWSCNIRAILAKFFSSSKAKFIISERTYIEKDVRRLQDKVGIAFTYRFADKIIAVSEGVRDGLIKYFKVLPDRITTIYNPFDLEEIKKKAGEPLPAEFRNLSRPWVVSAGRLSYEKNYSFLLKAYAEYKKVSGEGTFIIMGKGEMEDELKTIARKLGIENSVYWAGFQKNPYSIMKNSDVFVLGSHYEGFPNVIVEAMATGVPVISTDCPSGPSEIITNYLNGILVPVNDTEKLCKAILEVLKNPDLRQKLIAEGYKRAADFSLDKIIPQYRNLLESFGGKNK